MDGMSKIEAKHINDRRSLQIEATFSSGLGRVVASMPRELGELLGVRSCIMSGLPTHLVPELNAGPVRDYISLPL